MRTIVRMKFGSHLYGTATPNSDLDYKSVFVPSARDILLRKGRDTLSNSRPKSEGEKNFAGEVDEEAYSLQRYLQFVAEGQTVALDMLFAPSGLHEQTKGEWRWLQLNSHRLVSRKSAAFVGYCRRQANKYGIKGSRVAAAQNAVHILAVAVAYRGAQARLGEIECALEAVCGEHIRLIDIEGATDVHGAKRSVRHWEVCDRKMPLTQTIKSAHEVMQRLLAGYGERAKKAAVSEGVDWKALSHAVRVGREAIELLTTGQITFPRPEAEHLVNIKTGKLLYQPVSEEIEQLLVEVEDAASRSTLPAEPDLAWMDDFIVEVHGAEIRAAR